MKKYSKILMIMLVGTFIFSGCDRQLAENDVETPGYTPIYTNAIDSEVPDVEYPLDLPTFVKTGGVITEIRSNASATAHDIGEGFYILIEYMDRENEIVDGACITSGTQAYLNLFVESGRTMILAGEELEVGMAIIAFYECFAECGLYITENGQQSVTASVIAPLDYDWVHVDRFDENFISFDGTYSLLVLDGAEIMLQDGTPFDGSLNELINRALVVYVEMSASPEPNGPLVHGIATSRIVVLFERAVHPMLTLSPEDLDMFWDSMFDPQTVQIVVNRNAIDAPVPFVNRDYGVVMVPVAAIAEALGFVVSGEGADVVFGGGYTFTVGLDMYSSSMRGEIIELFAPPELHNNVLFVPLSFFSEAMGYAVYIEDGNIIVRQDTMASLPINIELATELFLASFDYIHQVDYIDAFEDIRGPVFEGEGDRIVVWADTPITNLELVGIDHDFSDDSNRFFPVVTVHFIDDCKPPLKIRSGDIKSEKKIP